VWEEWEGRGLRGEKRQKKKKKKAKMLNRLKSAMAEIEEGIAAKLGPKDEVPPSDDLDTSTASASSKNIPSEMSSKI
jgi:hypothetical protein